MRPLFLLAQRRRLASEQGGGKVEERPCGTLWLPNAVCVHPLFVLLVPCSLGKLGPTPDRGGDGERGREISTDDVDR